MAGDESTSESDRSVQEFLTTSSTSSGDDLESGSLAGAQRRGAGRRGRGGGGGRGRGGGRRDKGKGRKQGRQRTPVYTHKRERLHRRSGRVATAADAERRPPVAASGSKKRPRSARTAMMAAKEESDTDQGRACRDTRRRSSKDAVDVATVPVGRDAVHGGRQPLQGDPESDAEYEWVQLPFTDANQSGNRSQEQQLHETTPSATLRVPSWTTYLEERALLGASSSVQDGSAWSGSEAEDNDGGKTLLYWPPAKRARMLDARHKCLKDPWPAHTERSLAARPSPMPVFETVNGTTRTLCRGVPSHHGQPRTLGAEPKGNGNRTPSAKAGISTRTRAHHPNSGATADDNFCSLPMYSEAEMERERKMREELRQAEAEYEAELQEKNDPQLVVELQSNPELCARIAWGRCETRVGNNFQVDPTALPQVGSDTDHTAAAAASNVCGAQVSSSVDEDGNRCEKLWDPAEAAKHCTEQQLQAYLSEAQFCIAQECARGEGVKSCIPYPISVDFDGQESISEQLQHKTVLGQGSRAGGRRELHSFATRSEVEVELAARCAPLYMRAHAVPAPQEDMLDLAHTLLREHKYDRVSAIAVLRRRVRANRNLWSPREQMAALLSQFMPHAERDTVIDWWLHGDTNILWQRPPGILAQASSPRRPSPKPTPHVTTAPASISATARSASTSGLVPQAAAALSLSSAAPAPAPATTTATAAPATTATPPPPPPPPSPHLPSPTTARAVSSSPSFSAPRVANGDSDGVGPLGLAPGQLVSGTGPTRVPLSAATDTARLDGAPPTSPVRSPTGPGSRAQTSQLQSSSSPSSSTTLSSESEYVLSRSSSSGDSEVSVSRSPLWQESTCEPAGRPRLSSVPEQSCAAHTDNRVLAPAPAPAPAPVSVPVSVPMSVPSSTSSQPHGAGVIGGVEPAVGVLHGPTPRPPSPSAVTANAVFPALQAPGLKENEEAEEQEALKEKREKRSGEQAGRRREEREEGKGRSACTPMHPADSMSLLLPLPLNRTREECLAYFFRYLYPTICLRVDELVRDVAEWYDHMRAMRARCGNAAVAVAGNVGIDTAGTVPAAHLPGTGLSFLQSPLLSSSSSSSSFSSSSLSSSAAHSEVGLSHGHRAQQQPPPQPQSQQPQMPTNPRTRFTPPRNAAEKQQQQQQRRQRILRGQSVVDEPVVSEKLCYCTTVAMEQAEEVLSGSGPERDHALKQLLFSTDRFDSFVAACRNSLPAVAYRELCSLAKELSADFRRAMSVMHRVRLLFAHPLRNHPRFSAIQHYHDPALHRGYIPQRNTLVAQGFYDALPLFYRRQCMPLPIRYKDPETGVICEARETVPAIVWSSSSLRHSLDVTAAPPNVVKSPSFRGATAQSSGVTAGGGAMT